MRGFFYPKSVAIFGISNSPDNLGRRIIENMDRFGFKEEIYPIGEREEYVLGRKIRRTIDEIEEVPELAVFLIPARKIPAQLEACGRKGIRYAVIESGGFSEFGDLKRGMEEEVLGIASRWGIKIIGPNCVGVTNGENGLILPFYPMYRREMKVGSVSIISQSGGLVHDIILYATAEDLGMNKLVSLGNKLMIDENDCLEYLISDPGTKAIGIHLENISDGRRLMDLAASTDKPIVLLKGNISPSSHEIAKFHTASLAGDDLVTDAALRQAGVHRVHDLREMIDTLKILTLPLLKGHRLAILTRSGGHAVLAADAVYRHRLSLATFSDQFFSLVEKEKKGEVMRVTNPIDLGQIFDLEVQAMLAERALQEENVDGVVFGHGYNYEEHGDETKAFIRDIQRMVSAHGKPVALCMVSAKEEWFLMKESGFPIFTQAEDGIKALAKSLDHFHYLSERARGIPIMGGYKRSNKTQPAEPAVMMGVEETFALLKGRGLPLADYAIVGSIEEALQVARQIGYPVALKVASPQILHKTEQGAVKLNLVDDTALEQAMSGMAAESYLVQRMSPRGYEVILGGKRDREFGPVLLFGLGGVLTEVFRDTAIRVAPINEAQAEQMIGDTKGAALLRGFRGQPPADVKALTNCLLKVSALLTDRPEIANIDINPLIASQDGKGCVIVDAKIEYNKASTII